MVDDVAGDDVEEAPRRSTFQEPLEENLPSSESFLLEEATVQPDTPVTPKYFAPPVRTSRTQQDIIAAFESEGSSGSGDKIAELEEQLALQSEEEAAFASWAVVIRETRPDRAAEIIAHEREIFDGAEPSELVFEPVEAAELPDTTPLEAEATVEEEDAVQAQDLGEIPVDPAPVSNPDPDPDPEPASAPETVSAPEPIDAAAGAPPRSEVWPLMQGGLVDEPVSMLSDSEDPPFQGLWPLVSTWGFALVPFLGLTAGVWVVSMGLSFFQALVVASVAALVIGFVVASLAKVSTPIQNTFGRVGSVLPALLMVVLRLMALALVLWWVSRTAAELAVIAGWWSGPEWVAHTVAAVVLGGVSFAHVFFRASVMRVTLWASAGLGVLGTTAVIVRTAPEIVAPPTWTWTAEILPLFSAGSLVLVLGLVAFAPVANSLASLAPRSGSRLVATMSGIASVLPLGLLMSYAAWMSESAPGFALGILRDPIATMGSGLGTWFPAPMLVVLVLPFTGFLAIGLWSLVGSLKEMSVPGPRSAYGSVLMLTVGGLVALGILFESSFLDALPDAFFTAGVIVAACVGAIAIDSVISGKVQATRGLSWRWGPFVGMAVAVAVGLGVVSSDISWLSWQGYLLGFLESQGFGDLAPGNLGIVFALLLGGMGSALSAIPVKKTPVSIDV